MVGRSLGQVWAAWRIELQFLSTRVTQPGKENGLRYNDYDRALWEQRAGPLFQSGLRRQE